MHENRPLKYGRDMQPLPAEVGHELMGLLYSQPEVQLQLEDTVENLALNVPWLNFATNLEST